MKTLLLCAIAICSVAPLWAQKEFVSGYYLDNSGKRIEGFFQAVDLESINDLDATVSYRLLADAQVIELKASTITEIAIGNDIKYQKFTVDIDDSNFYKVITSNKYPEFIKKTIFVNVLIEGKANLYVFDSGSGPKYLFRKSDDQKAPKQLVYKKYLFSNVEEPRENLQFRQQLADNLSCPGDSFSKFSSLTYNKAVLMDIFAAYNACNNSAVTIFKNEKKSKFKFLFSLYGGVYNYTSQVNGKDSATDKEKKATPSYGFDVEMLTPGQKWGVFVRFDYQKLESKPTVTYESATPDDFVYTDIYEIEGSATSLTVGTRYHINYGSKHDFYVDGGLGFFFPSAVLKHVRKATWPGSQNGTIGTFEEVETESNFYAGIDIGYVFLKKFGISLRYETNRIIIDSAPDDLTAEFGRAGVCLSYTF